MVNNIKNNAISEIDAKKNLNELKEIKNVGIMEHKKRTSKEKQLLNLFNNLLNTILTNKISENQENENEKEESRKEENEDEDYENKYENEDEDDYYEKECENENEDDVDDETMD